MFGSKKAKEDALDKAVKVIRQKGEVTQTELARELKCSVDAIEDYLASLHERGELLCQKGQKISLMERWSKK
jgi:Mn-dependent DtxR family transcriptional regulator